MVGAEIHDSVALVGMQTHCAAKRIVELILRALWRWAVWPSLLVARTGVFV
jgi:hypothetical protein